MKKMLLLPVTILSILSLSLNSPFTNDLDVSNYNVSYTFREPINEAKLIRKQSFVKKIINRENAHFLYEYELYEEEDLKDSYFRAGFGPIYVENMTTISYTFAPSENKFEENFKDQVFKQSSGLISAADANLFYTHLTNKTNHYTSQFENKPSEQSTVKMEITIDSPEKFGVYLPALRVNVGHTYYLKLAKTRVVEGIADNSKYDIAFSYFGITSSVYLIKYFKTLEEYSLFASEEKYLWKKYY